MALRVSDIRLTYSCRSDVTFVTLCDEAVYSVCPVWSDSSDDESLYHVE